MRGVATVACVLAAFAAAAPVQADQADHADHADPWPTSLPASQNVAPDDMNQQVDVPANRRSGAAGAYLPLSLAARVGAAGAIVVGHAGYDGARG